MKRVFLLLGFLLAFLPGALFAQLKTADRGISFSQLLRYGVNPVGLFSRNFLSPDRFQMHQSYSFMVSSINGHAFNQAMYLNTMQFKVSEPLTLSLQWGYLMNQPFGKIGAFSPGFSMKNGPFLSNARLDYKISDKARLRMEFNSYPAGTYYSGLGLHNDWPGY
jgi:hypothetical protein